MLYNFFRAKHRFMKYRGLLELKFNGMVQIATKNTVLVVVLLKTFHNLGQKRN